MDIVVKGRRAPVTDRFREHVESKLAKLERFDHKAFRIDVELSHERNPRLSGVRERIELTCFSRGPVIRAEAASHDAYSALDLAIAKLSERLRRSADRRLRRHAQAPPTAEPIFPNTLSPISSVSVNGSAPMRTADQRGRPNDTGNGVHRPAPTMSAAHPDGSCDVEPGESMRVDTPPLIVREKSHDAPTMTLDDALSNMELVGHDFYLFREISTGLPGVVYRRRGYDYGVIWLRTVGTAGLSDTADTEAVALGATLAR
ncbi:MAG: ribosome hibernation-promoting factor, HPF/YfiA family [Frankia sp.]